jgi:uncharacterized membrane protein (DUF485 family)
MNDSIYERIEQSPRFQELVTKRSRFAWTLSIIMLGLYVAFILIIAFDPSLFGTPISEGSPTTWGIPAGVGLILSAFVLTGIYVYRANGEFDDLTQAVLDEVKQ